jgi:uncharacterized protein YjdB
MNELEVGATMQLEPTWSSASDAIATVSEDGTVTAVSPGTVEIYCTVRGLSVATVVSVVKAPEPEAELEQPED